MKNFVLSAAVLALISAPALAHDDKDHGHGDHGKFRDKMFDKVDTNHDGAISREESAAFHDKQFTEMDKDGDNKLTKDELKTFFDKKRDEHAAKKELKEKKSKE